MGIECEMDGIVKLKNKKCIFIHIIVSAITMKPKLIPIIFLPLILIIFFGYFVFLKNYVPDWQIRGQVGDAFGTLNAFFSALALLTIIFTIIQQNTVINQAKVDSQQSAKEFSESVNQFKQQQKIQALSILISIYERKIEEYKKSNNEYQAIQTSKKLSDFAEELENLLAQIK